MSGNRSGMSFDGDFSLDLSGFTDSSDTVDTNNNDDDELNVKYDESDDSLSNDNLSTKWTFKIPETPDRRRSTIKKPQVALDPIAIQLYDFHENRARLSVERKGICEEIAFDAVHKCLRKIEAVDNRFRASSLISQGIPYDGLQAEEPIKMDMLVQLSFGPKTALYTARDTVTGGVRIQPTSTSIKVWDDCQTTSGFILASKVNALLRKYIKKAVAMLNINIKENKRDKLPKGLTSIQLEPGPVIQLTVNRDISIDVLPAFVNSDYRGRDGKSSSSSSHIVCKAHYMNQLMWRMSFYVGEKNKLRALATTGCRMQLLRILTEIRDTEDELKPLSSFHLMHLLFHESDAIPDPHEWATDKITPRFFGLLENLKRCLKEGELKHYFMQPPEFESVNLFGNFDGKTLSDMYDIVEDIQQTQGMSVLKQQGLQRRQSMWPWEYDFMMPAEITPPRK